jgi:predicted DNA-binding protein (MmcQ/YjbR family)
MASLVAEHRSTPLTLSTLTAAVKAMLEAKPGAVAQAMSAPKASVPSAIIYKVAGKMFGILSVRGDEFVILKCDPHLAEILRGQYAGIGHRSHLERRFWISIELDADVPAEETERLVAHSYEQVCAKLTRKQRAALGPLSD